MNVDGTITSDGLTVDGTTSLEDVTVSLDDTTSADSMPALTPSGSELVVKNTNNSADYTAQLLQRIDEQDSGEITEYQVFSNI